MTDSSAFSLLIMLPPEIITELMEELDWFSLMKLRKTCRYLYDISKTLAVWQRQLRQYLSAHRLTPPLEAPLETFTAPELEDWVSRRVSADAGWKSHNRRPTRIRKIDKSVARACLVPGGRWLLIGSGDGAVVAYDLDAHGVQGKLLLHLPDQRKIESMCVSINQESQKFAFNLAISSNPRFFRDDSIHIWAVTIDGRGHEACLRARPLRFFVAPSNTTHGCNIALRDGLLARKVYNGNGTCGVDIFNWVQTSSTSPCKHVIQVDEIIHHIQLLPGERLLAFTQGFIRIYEVRPTFSEDPILSTDTTSLPLWQLACPLGNRTANGGISQPSIDATRTQFTFVAENPNTIYDLTIPHDASQVPVLRKIANFPGDHYPAIAIGFEKMFIAFERNWKADRDNLSGSVIRLRIPCNDDGEMTNTVSTTEGVHSYEYPKEWYVGWPPLLDEGSGRIVQPFGRRGLVVVDTALCFTASKKY